MSQIILNNLPSTTIDRKINFLSTLEDVDKELLSETIEYLEDYLYVSNRENDDNVKYVKESEVLDLISKYK